jgi:hypothetical protein
MSKSLPHPKFSLVSDIDDGKSFHLVTNKFKPGTFGTPNKSHMEPSPIGANIWEFLYAIQ